MKARASELEFIRLSAEQARAAGHIRDKPLIVLTAGLNSDWVQDLQMRLTHLSTKGKRIIVPTSGHDVPSDAPNAIVNVIYAMKNCQAVLP